MCAPKLGIGTSCPRDAACTSGFCNDLTGSCDDPHPLGDACSKQTGCLSGHCGESLLGGKICCNSDCTGICAGCNGAGTCVNASAGTDPKNKCDVAPGSCNSGSCNGSGQCGLLPAGAPCNGGCSFATGSMQWSMCNASGMCVAQNDYSCFTGSCDFPGPACTCTSIFDCPFAGAYYCKFNGGNSTCVPRKTIGQPCQGYSECFSNQCDGVSCVKGTLMSGSACTYDDECSQGLHCGGGTPLVMPGHCQ